MSQSDAEPSSSAASVHYIADTTKMQELAQAAAAAKIREYHKLGAEIRTKAVKELDRVVEKYTHAVEITHKAELEKLYGQFRTDYAAEDAKIAGARQTLKTLTGEMQDVLADLAKTVAEVVADESKRHAGFSETIRGYIKEEEAALAHIGGPVYMPDTSMV